MKGGFPGQSLAYVHRDALYLNLTNRCPVACRFCIKRDWKWQFHGLNLRIEKGEPSGEEVWSAAATEISRRPFPELVFCGYGECTYRLPVMEEIAERARGALPRVRLRLNTIGLGSLIWGRSIVSDLSRFLDSVSVSLNTADPDQWKVLHAPHKRFEGEGFYGAVAFIGECARSGLETTVTAVEQPEVDLEAVRALAQGLGARFRVRPPLN